MAINNRPYINIKIENKDYSKVTVDANTIWRKPLNYVKQLLILDRDTTSQVVRSNDALTDRGLATFTVRRLEDSVYRDILEPSQNNTTSMAGETPIILDTQKVIKYEDRLIINYSISSGYYLDTQDFKMGSVTLNKAELFTLLNNMDLKLSVRPTVYSLTVTKDANVLSYTINRTPGRISQIQNYLNSTVSSGDDILTLDRLEISDSYTFTDGYILDEENSTIPSSVLVSSNVNYIIASKPITSRLQVNTPTYGLSSYTVYRTAGTVAQAQGVSSGYINNGDLLYTGDTLTINTTPETGYSVPSVVAPTLTSSYLLNNPTVTINITSTPLEKSVRATISGDTTLGGNPTVTNLKVTVIPGEITRRTGTTQNYVAYEGEYTSNVLFYAHYGDVLRFAYTPRTGYSVSPKEGADYNQEITVVNNVVSSVTVSVIQYTLTYTTDAGVSSAVFERTASPYKGAPLTTMSSGDPVYYGDTIHLSVEASTGYVIRLTGTNYSSKISDSSYYYNSGNINVTITGVPVERSISFTDTTGLTSVKITLTRVGIKSGRTVGQVLYNGAPQSTLPNVQVYYGEQIQVEYTASAGYTPKPTETVDVTLYDILLSGSNVDYYGVYINSARGLSTVKITCVSPGYSSHTAGQVLYNGDVQYNDSYRYCFVARNEQIRFEMTTQEAYVTPEPFNITASSSDIVVVGTANVKTYRYSLTADSGVNSYTIERTNRVYPEPSSAVVVIENYSLCNYQDSVRYTALPKTGYIVNNPSSTVVMTESRSVSVTSHKIYGSLDINLTTGVSSITVTRNGTALSDGATIYYGDVLTISAVASTGYELDSYQSQYTFTPSSDGETYTPTVTASIKRYNYTVQRQTGVANNVVTTRTSSPMGGNIGVLTDPYVYYGDVLEVAYSSETNYVVGTGYSTTATKTVTCTGSALTVVLEATQTITLSLTQLSDRGTELSSGDRISIVVNYPDNPSTPVNWDSNKRIRVDQSIRIYPSNITFSAGLPSMSKVILDKGNNVTRDVSLTTSGGQSYFEIPMTDAGTIIRGIKPCFSPLSVTSYFKVTSDIIKYIDPALAQVSLLITHNYATGSQETKTFSLYDYSTAQGTEYSVQVYYKDTIRVNYTDVTGWTCVGSQVSCSSTPLVILEINNPGTFTIDKPDDFNVNIKREIITDYSLDIYNSYAKFTNITIGDTQVVTAWSSPSGQSVKSYDVAYGERFKIVARYLDGNSPMDLEYASHNNDTWYYATGDENVYYRNYSRLTAPVNLTLDNWRFDSNYDLIFRIKFGNYNNYNGSESYPTKIVIQEVNPSTLQPYSTKIDTTVNTTGGTSTATNVFEYTITTEQEEFDYDATYSIKVYFEPKTLSGVNRTRSLDAVIYQTVTIPAYEEDED